MNRNEPEDSTAITNDEFDHITPSEVIDNPDSCIVQHQVHTNTIKLLLISPNEDQVLFCFETPFEDCTVQDLLDEAKIPKSKNFHIYLIENSRMGINYVVQYVSRYRSGSGEAGVDNVPYTEGANNSSGFFSSMDGEDHCNHSRAQNKIPDKVNVEVNDLEILEPKISRPSGIMKRRSPRIIESSRFCDDFANRIIDSSSSDEGERREQDWEESEKDTNRMALPSPRISQAKTDTVTIHEEEDLPHIATNFTPTTSDIMDYHENIEGGGTPWKIENRVCDSSIVSSYTFLFSKIIMIGSYSYTPQESVRVSRSGVSLRVPDIADNSNTILVELKFGDIAKVVAHFGKKHPALFFYLKENATTIVRESLGMEDPAGFYYDIMSTDKTKRVITLLLDELPEKSKLVLKMLLTPKRLLLSVDEGEAEDLLFLVTPRNIRPQIKLLMNNAKRVITSNVKNTVDDEVELLDKKTQSSTRISEKTRPKIERTVNNENKMLVKKTSGPIRVSERTKLILENSINEQIELDFRTTKTAVKRSSEVSSRVSDTVNDKSEILLVYPPPPARGGIPINTQDYACLRKGRYLNDVIIDFYLKYLTEKILSEEDRNRTHVFSVHFYKRLTSENPPTVDNERSFSIAKRRHINVQTWTKRLNIFEKDFIVVPINEDAHWFLAIICFPGLVGKTEVDSTAAETNKGEDAVYERRKAKAMKLQMVTRQDKGKMKKLPCILIFDSLAGLDYRAKSVLNNLRDYLNCEHMAKLGTEGGFSNLTMKGGCPNVPQQSNFSDCGLYVLQYVESFFSDPITDFTLPIATLRNWFTESVVTRKRWELSKLILELKDF